MLAYERQPSERKACRIVAAGVWLLAALTAIADQYTGTRQSTYLYTAPDPSAAGGLCARMADRSRPLLHVFAIPQDKPSLVYQGAVAADGCGFSFKGLPVAKYDLMVVCADRFIEGFTLSTEPDTLSPKDRQQIEAAIMKSVPFFDTKRMHRCLGTTGREGKARCVLQEVRTKPVTLQDASVRSDIQVRSIKLAWLEDVGVGWQLVQTREIIRTEVTPDDRKDILSHVFHPGLGGIRVTDHMKDLGAIDLKPAISSP